MIFHTLKVTGDASPEQSLVLFMMVILLKDIEIFLGMN